MNQTGKIQEILESNKAKTAIVVGDGVSYEFAEDIIGKTHLESGFPKDLSKEWESRIHQVFKTGKPCGWEFEWESVAGKVFLDWRLMPEHDENGNVYSVLGISRDITERKNSEIELREKKVQYQNLADAGIALIWTSGADKLCNYFNQPWLDFTGRTFEQEAGNGWVEGVHPDDLERCVNTYVTAFDRHEPSDMEYRLRHVSGEYRWLRDIGTPNYNNSGDFIGYIGHCFDISRQKSIEDELKITNAILQSAMDQSPAGIAIADAPDGKLRYVNKAGLMIRGGDYDSIVKGIGTDEYVSSWKIYDLEGNPLKTDEVPLARTVMYGETCSREFIIRRNDFDDRIVLANAAPIKNEAGETAAGIVVFTDITERKEAEELLKENHMRLDLAMKTANMAWWEMDISTGTVKFEKRKAEMLGYPPEQFKHYKDFTDLLHPEDYANAMNAMREHFEGKNEKYEIEYRILTKSGDYKWFHDIGSIIKKDVNGKPLTIAGLVFNITERMLVEKELEKYRNHLEELVKVRTEELERANELLKITVEKEHELNEMKSGFISTTSHEFRTPLTSILSSTELLQRFGSKWSDEKKDEHFNRIITSIDYLTHLLDDILTLNRADTGKISFNPEKLNLQQFANECLLDAESLITDKHELKFNYKSKQKEFQLDPKLMRFVFNNLLSNAIKYSPQGGDVTLQISSDKEYLCIEVSDEGMGIPPEDLPKIFDAFYRTKAADDIAGTGLGLAILKRSVELHNGEITVDSELGKGTTFAVKIPIATVTQ